MTFKTRTLLGLTSALALCCTLVNAQVDYLLDTPEWVEDAVAPPPAFSKDRLIPIDMPPHVTVRVGVDPESISVGKDGVVRYVMVMRNASGSTGAVYEGIHCASDEVKTYARFGSGGQWNMVGQPEWKAVNDNMPSHHAQAFARQGGCKDHYPPSKSEIIEVLKERQKTPPTHKGN